MTTYLQNVINPLHDGSWHGKAGDATREAVSKLYYQKLAAADKYLESVYLLLQDAGAGLQTAKDRLTAALGVANTAGVQVDGNGDLQLIDVSAADWDNPPIKWAMKAQNMIYQARRMATFVNESVCPGLQFATKFPNGTWMQDPDGDLQVAQTLSSSLGDSLGNIATEELPHQDTPPQPHGLPLLDKIVASQLLHEALQAAVVGYFLPRGWTWAASLLGHWLDNSGAPFQVSLEAMIQDIPTFKNAVSDCVNNACRPLTGHYGELDPYDSIAFDTDWQPTSVEDGSGKVQSLDWYYALNDFRFRVVGIASPLVDGHRAVEYTVGVWKPYVFGPPRKPIHVGPLLLDQQEIEDVHLVGLAQNFIAQGISHHVAEYPI